MDRKIVKLDLVLILNSALMGAFIVFLTWIFLGIVNIGKMINDIETKVI